ncbi:MAG TPA: FAD-binding oxidoreductase [Lichenihabitans sp.]|jgi:FAD/FMN-containing dehydrogenase|nr:FAD-binding oxidoreductase [Lichenihabitans sp.]
MITGKALDELRNAIGAIHVRTDEAVEALDPGWHPDNLKAGVLVAPESTAEVAAVLTICRAYGIGVVTHGGRTGLVGGAISAPGEIVLSTVRLNRIVDLDPVARVAVVEAGVTLEALQQAAQIHRLDPGIDIPSRGSATIGGMVSTNAGGIMAFRNGVMRHRVLGLEAVLADGSIYSDLTRVVKTTAGYDLKHLFIGAEGTLGIVTRVALNLDVTPPATVTAFFGLPSIAAVLDVIRMALDSPAGSLRAAEALWQSFFHLTATTQGFADASVDAGMPLYLLLTLGGADEGAMRDAFEQMFERAIERYPNMSGIVATSARQERDLWRLREDTDAIYRAFPAAPSYDVSVPLSGIDAYVTRALDGLRCLDPAFCPFVFGHLADGNLHIVLNHAGPLRPDRTRAVEAILYQDLAGFGGSFSAEHGIGAKRVEALRTYGDPTKRALMRLVRDAIDPSAILSRNKVIVRP